MANHRPYLRALTHVFHYVRCFIYTVHTGSAAVSDHVSGVGRPGAVDGEGYIPPSALELPPPAAATVADAAAVLAAAPARLTRAAAGRNHDNASRRTAVAPAAAAAAASGVGRPGAVDGEYYIPSSALERPPFAAVSSVARCDGIDALG